jgi:hypothetical protein
MGFKTYGLLCVISPGVAPGIVEAIAGVRNCKDALLREQCSSGMQQESASTSIFGNLCSFLTGFVSWKASPYWAR